MPIKSADEFVNDTLAKEGQTVQPPDIQGGINQLRQQIQAAFMSATGLDAAGQAIRGEMTPEEAQMFALGAIPMVATAPEKAAGEAAEEAATQIAKRIMAYHGSPYDFAKFDMSKIGTGEGAQAYGHGLYFAENPEVSNTYRTANSRPGLGSYPASLAKSASDKAAAAGLTGEEAKKFALNQLIEESKTVPTTGRQAFYDAMNNFDELRSGRVGKMYEVNINADPEHFLDWDKPLSEQSRVIQGAVAANSHKLAPTYYNQYRSGELPGFSIYHALGGDASASDALRQAGIPGIKYLDQGSRVAPDINERIADLRDRISNSSRHPADATAAANQIAKDKAALADLEKRQAQPTSNYVVFDASLIEILKKYGIAGLITALGARQQDGGS